MESQSDLAESTATLQEPLATEEDPDSAAELRMADM